MKLEALSDKKIAGVVKKSTPIGGALNSSPAMADERAVALRCRKDNGTFYRQDARDRQNWEPLHSTEVADERKKFVLPGLCGIKTESTTITEVIKGMSKAKVAPRSLALRGRKPGILLYIHTNIVYR